MARLWALTIATACALVALPARADEAPHGVLGLGGFVIHRPTRPALTAARAALTAHVAAVQAEDRAHARQPELASSLRQRLTLAPEDPRACEWQRRIALAAVAGSDREAEAREILRLRDVWWSVRASDHPDEPRRACQAASLALLRPLATLLHGEYEAERLAVRRTDAADPPAGSSSFALATRAYEGVLRSSWRPTSDSRLRREYAGMLYTYANELERAGPRRAVEATALLRRAREVQLEVLATDPGSEYAEESAYVQLLLLIQALHYDVSHGQRVTGCTTDSEGICVPYDTGPWSRPEPLARADIPRPEIPYSPADREMLAAYELALRHLTYPRDRAHIRFLSAYLQLRRNHLETARLAFERILRDHPETAHAAWSAELLLGLMAARWRAPGNTPEQRSAAAEALVHTLALLHDSQPLRHAHAADARYIYMQLFVAVHEERGLAAEAAGAPLRCATVLAEILEHAQYELDDEHESRLHDQIATCYRAAGQPGDAIRHRRRDPGTSDHAARLVDDYLAAGRFNYAASAMFEFADHYPDDPRAATLLAEAHRIHIGLGDERAAAEVHTRLRELMTPRRGRRARVR